MNEKDRMIEVAWRAASEYSDYLEKTLNGGNTTDITDVSALFPKITTFPEFLTDHLIAHNVTLPPVSVGQTVYIIRRPIDKPEWIDECVVKNVIIEYTADGKTCRFKSHNFEATEKDIGAWVFLTREEAEQALKEEGIK